MRLGYIPAANYIGSCVSVILKSASVLLACSYIVNGARASDGSQKTLSSCTFEH
jgi:hypothetical protein